MDVSQQLLSITAHPTFLFRRVTPKEALTPSWLTSSLNPKNRVESLDITKSKWRIDGSHMSGRQFYVVPLQLLPDLVPLRIDVFIEDQSDHPINLRNGLDSASSACMGHPNVANLGISRYICLALDAHCERYPHFLEEYQVLPFGSRLVFKSITADVRSMELEIVPGHDLEKDMLSITTLQTLWLEDVPDNRWPRSIELRFLRFKRQIHDSITLVELCDEEASITHDFIFKSSVSDIVFLYHELKFLLSTQSHGNMMPRPAYIITKKSRFGGKRGVCGFLLPYYPLGSLNDALKQKPLGITINEKLHWSKQILLALLHVQVAAGTFYSDLRPDNVLLAQSSTSNCRDAILCDFEQRGNWHEWCAPEVLYSMYARDLSRSTYFKSHDELVEEARAQVKSAKNGPHGSNPAWFSLSPQAREKATVYSFGLLLYCLFEGVCNPRASLVNAGSWKQNIEFPNYEHTPESVRVIIDRCTIDAPERRGLSIGRVRRVDGELFPPTSISRAGIAAPTESATVEEAVLEALTGYWENEVRRMQAFFRGNDWKAGTTGRLRPTLHEILVLLNNTGDTECLGGNSRARNLD